MTEHDHDELYKGLLANQLEMNPQTWAHLQARGVDEQTLLVLDFYYTAPGKEEADALVAFLSEKTTFSVQAVGERGSFLKKRWRVGGRTKPSTTSLAMLNDWVTFMVNAGAKHGRCHFDGWGVEISATRPDTPAELRAKGQASTTNGTVGALAQQRVKPADQAADEPGDTPT